MNSVTLEKRLHRRYDLRLPVRFTISERHARSRHGRTVLRELSTVGLSFRDRCSRNVGSYVSVVIDWPIRYAEDYSIELHATGFVARSENGVTAVTVSSYRFKVLSIPLRVAAVS